MKFLSSFKGIEILKLRNNKIEDIQFLKSLKKVRYLDIGKNLISEIEILKNNKNLEYAFLDGNPIKRNIQACPTDFELKILNQFYQSLISLEKLNLELSNSYDNSCSLEKPVNLLIKKMGESWFSSKKRK